MFPRVMGGLRKGSFRFSLTRRVMRKNDAGKLAVKGRAGG